MFKEGSYTQRSKKDTDEIFLLATDTQLSDDNIQTGDTGATSHLTNFCEGMYDVQEMTASVTRGDGEKLKVNQTGKKKVTEIQKSGDT